MKTQDHTPDMLGFGPPEMFPLDSVITRELRRAWAMDKERLRDMGKSLNVRQISDILIAATGEVISGNSRVHAARLVGMTHLRGRRATRALTPSEMKQIEVFENFHRASLTVQEQSRNCIEFLELNPGWEQKQVAAALNLDPSMVTRLLSPTRVIPAVAEAFYADALTLSAVYEISKCDPAEQHEALAMARNGASREVIRETRQRKRSAGTGQSAVAKVRVPLSNGLSVMVSGAAVTLQDFIDALLLAAKEAKAALKDNQDAKSFALQMANRAKA